MTTDEANTLQALAEEIRAALDALIAERNATENLRMRAEVEARTVAAMRPHPDDDRVLRAYIEAESRARILKLWVADEWSNERSAPLAGRLTSVLQILKSRLQDLAVDVSALAFLMPQTVADTARKALALIDDLATKASAERLTEEEWRQRESKRRVA